MSDDVAKLEWLRIKAVAAGLQQLMVFQKRHPEYTKTTDGVNNATKRLMDAVKGYRSERRYRSGLSAIEAEHVRIRSFLEGMILRERPSTSVIVKIGGEVKVERRKRSTTSSARIVFHVGHMWRRKVYDVFYRNDLISKSGGYILLSADRVKVNSRNVELYVGYAYNFYEDAVKEVYLAVTKVGKRQAVMKHTASNAVKAATDLITEEIEEKITGDSLL